MSIAGHYAVLGGLTQLSSSPTTSAHRHPNWASRTCAALCAVLPLFGSSGVARCASNAPARNEKPFLPEGAATMTAHPSCSSGVALWYVNQRSLFAQANCRVGRWAKIVESAAGGRLAQTLGGAR